MKSCQVFVLLLILNLSQLFLCESSEKKKVKKTKDKASDEDGSEENGSKDDGSLEEAEVPEIKQNHPKYCRYKAKTVPIQKFGLGVFFYQILAAVCFQVWRGDTRADIPSCRHSGNLIFPIIYYKGSCDHASPLSP